MVINLKPSREVNVLKGVGIIYIFLSYSLPENQSLGKLKNKQDCCIR